MTSAVPARPDAHVWQGVLCALLVVFIWAVYPVVTRLSVTQTLSPADLFALRFGVSAAILAPYLVWRVSVASGDAWLKGIGPALCQGMLAALVMIGLQLAPARHASALVQGMIPAAVVILGGVLLGHRVQGASARGFALAAGGAAILVAGSAGALDQRQLQGDALFLVASLLGAGYLLQMRRYGLSPTTAAAFVALYCAVGFLPWYLVAGETAFARATSSELIAQGVYQGVLVGVVSFIALNRAVEVLGALRMGAFLATVPALTAIIAMPVLGEWPPLADWAALALLAAGAWSLGRQPTANPSRPVGRLDRGPGSCPSRSQQ